MRVDLDPERRVEMVEKTARRTVPQIFIGDTHVGGCDDLMALDHAGKLLPLLSGSPFIKILQIFSTFIYQENHHD